MMAGMRRNWRIKAKTLCNPASRGVPLDPFSKTLRGLEHWCPSSISGSGRRPCRSTILCIQRFRGMSEGASTLGVGPATRRKCLAVDQYDPANRGEAGRYRTFTAATGHLDGRRKNSLNPVFVKTRFPNPPAKTFRRLGGESRWISAGSGCARHLFMTSTDGQKEMRGPYAVIMLEFFGKGPGPAQNTGLHKKVFPGESSTSDGGHRPPYH